MQRLPLVTSLVADEVVNVLNEEKGASTLRVLQEIKEENPVLMNALVAWFESFPHMSDEDRARYALGPVLVYQLLRAQLALENVSQQPSAK